MNGCGHHHVGHIGILGVDKNGEEWYQITIGGAAGADASLGQVIGPSVAKTDVAETLARMLDVYVEQRRPDERFLDTVRRLGVKPFKERAYAAPIAAVTAKSSTTTGRMPQEAEGNPAAALILSFDQWQNERESLDCAGWAPGRRLLQPAHKVELLAPDLSRFGLIAAEFPGPSEGRGYSQARPGARRHWKFTGELRATGYVRRDQLFFMARCGFNSFELPDADIDDAHKAFSTFSKAYQPANDAGLPLKLRRL